MRVDLHSHILPEMDDGAHDLKESTDLLRTLVKAEVNTVVLTPHFYRREENISSFLDRRKKSFDLLSAVCGGVRNCPLLLQGAEVYFYPSLPEEPDFYKLCIENTDYILLELPFDRFDDNFFRNYANFLNKCDKKIIIAHIERYLHFGNSPDDLLKLFDYGNVLAQMNCSSLARADFFKRKLLLKFISDGLISALGTDAHNLTSRPPEYGKAEKLIVSKCGSSVFNKLCKTSEMILKNMSVEDIRRV